MRLDRWAIPLAAALCGCASPAPAPGVAASRDGGRDATALVESGVDVPSEGPTDRCADGGAPSYPDGTRLAVDAPLPALTLPTLTGPLQLSRFHTPCERAPRLLVVRLLAAWSGPSQHHAAHTRRLLDGDDASRIDLVDVLLSGADNLPPDDRDLADWGARYDARPGSLARDDAARWQPLSLGPQQLPQVLLVDPRTMQFLRVLDVPDTHDLGWHVADALARIDGRPRTPQPAATLYDGRLPLDAWEMVQAMAPSVRPPSDPTNAFADDPRAATLGRALFFDTQLSANGAVACASCHAPETALADGRALGIGLTAGDRNTPSVATAAGQRWQFWDGRADSLWMQALGPMENPLEMGFTRLGLAQALAARYASQYAAVFGPLPPLDDRARFPAAGMPGQGPWDGMRASDQAAVNRLYANAGKAIAAFERTLRLGDSPFDRYARGDASALSAEARDGLRAYFVDGCAQCHYGPTLSDDSFHNIQFPSGRRDGQPDPGRYGAVEGLRASVFRADGAFSDSTADDGHLRRVAPVEAMRGQFHTPTLRNVAATGPWGHGGTFQTLTEVVRHYAQSGDRRDDLSTTGEIDRALGRFHQTEPALAALVALLQSLSAPVIVPP